MGRESDAWIRKSKEIHGENLTEKERRKGRGKRRAFYIQESYKTLTLMLKGSVREKRRNGTLFPLFFSYTDTVLLLQWKEIERKKRFETERKERVSFPL